MGRAYYRFGQDVALRLASGDAFALREAELGAIFDTESEPICLLRGTFSSSTYRALVARQVLAANPSLHALAQPVKVRLQLNPSLAATVAKDARTLSHVGRRLAQNIATDELARKLLTLEQWHFVAATPAEEATPVISSSISSSLVAWDEEQEEVVAKMVTEMANELWLAAEEAGEATQEPSMEVPIGLFEAVNLFFAEEGWAWAIDPRGHNSH